MDQSRLKTIQDEPIGNHLDAFRASFGSPERTLDTLSTEDLQNLGLSLLSSLQSHPAARKLPSGTGQPTLRSDLLRLISTVTSNDFDFDRIKPLLNAALTSKPDEEIWNYVYSAIVESTPPPRPVASSFQQTPWLRNTSSFANSSEYRKYMDGALRDELGVMYVDVPRFYETFFGSVVELETVSEAIFKSCKERPEGTKGTSPLFRDGWTGWPEDANETAVLSWFAKITKELAAFAEKYKANPKYKRRLSAQPNESVQGSIAKRKLDAGFVGFVKDHAGEDSRRHWSQILIPGELKKNPSADTASKARLDIGTYAREVLAAQDTRRFVLGFTLCGSLMRIWEFDRLGGIASEQFDINQNGPQFVSTILGFLWMSNEALGFDPTIKFAGSQRFIEVERDGTKERLIIDQLITRVRCIAGRATTSWKAHLEGDPQTPLVIKDSWQYKERIEEGELLHEVTRKGVINVARYYYHETVQVCGTDDDIQSYIRKGIDITSATNYRQERSILSSERGTGRSTGNTSQKRSSGQTDAPLPPAKRSRSTSSIKLRYALPDRVHRRIILRDYGKPIYQASSRAAVLAALEGCIEGHESLYKAGFLHRDISINNLMINEDEAKPTDSWPSFLIDLDLAIKVQRHGASGAMGMTGTRAFMAIGALLGEQHSFMHDLESFFWVLFWMCIHYNGPDKSRVVPDFDKWNYIPTNDLAKLKLGTVSDESIFRRTLLEYSTGYYEPLIPCLTELRGVVFPNGAMWKKEDQGLYSQMRDILRKAQNDSVMVG